MQRFFRYLIAVLFLPGLMSCDQGGMDSDGTQATFAIRLKTNTTQAGKTSSASFSITDSGGTTFAITEARTNVRHVQFDFLESSSSSSRQISLNGPFIVDLITGLSNPPINAFDVEPGIYKRIDVRLDDTKASDGLLSGTDDLLDNTLLVKGSFDYDGVADRNFTFLLKFNEDVRFEVPGGISVNEGEIKDFVLNLVVDEWLNNINITECLDEGDVVLDDNGDLIINDDNGDCDNFEGAIKTYIKNNYDFN